MAAKYDVGILGVWFGCNYGSIATYYALEKTIERMGYRVLMVHRPYIKEFNREHMEKRHSLRFAREYYQISEALPVSEMDKIGQQCDIFVLGSDQIWNYGVTKIFGHSYFLDFAGDDKRKIAYAVSFGSDHFQAPRGFAKKALRCVRRMDAISVREESGVKTCRNTFGAEAVNVLDPVLMCDYDLLDDLAGKSAKPRIEEPFLAAYILDPTPEKRKALLWVAEQKHLRLVVMLDGWSNKFQKNKKAIGLDDAVVEDLQEEDWLYYIKHSQFVITDSFHGSCMAIRFHRPFLAIGNPARGTSRFESLLMGLKLWERYVDDAAQIPGRKELLADVDYREADRILEEKRAFSRKWLRDALEGKMEKKKPSPALRFKSFFHIRLCWIKYAVREKVKPLAKRVLRR